MANLLYTPIRDTYYRIIAADAPAPENIAAFMKSFSPIASLLMPAVLKKKLFPAFLKRGCQRKPDKVFPKRQIKERFLPADLRFLKSFFRYSGFSQLKKRDFILKVS